MEIFKIKSEKLPTVPKSSTTSDAFLRTTAFYRYGGRGKGKIMDEAQEMWLQISSLPGQLTVCLKASHLINGNYLMNPCPPHQSRCPNLLPWSCLEIQGRCVTYFPSKDHLEESKKRMVTLSRLNGTGEKGGVVWKNEKLSVAGQKPSGTPADPGTRCPLWAWGARRNSISVSTRLWSDSCSGPQSFPARFFCPSDSLCELSTTLYQIAFAKFVRPGSNVYK